MRSPRTLRQWITQLLPAQGRMAQDAAWELLRALMLGFTVQLTQLARQLDRESTTKSSRQRLDRWLERPHWQPPQIYARLLRQVARTFQGRAVVVLLIDATTLADGWYVLQVSVPFQGRALPLLRLLRPYQGATEKQGELLDQALFFLKQHLPGPRTRYVLVADRGFPNHALVRHLRRSGWRFVLRIKGNWKLNHPEHTGQLRQLRNLECTPRWFRDVVLGDRSKGEGIRIRHCVANVGAWHGPGHAEPWFLATSEPSLEAAVSLYRQRMRIESEFRDLKGPLGLDELAHWQKLDHVARFLAWMAVYEWRLAYLWLMNQLHNYARKWRVKGALSWIRTTREWLHHRLRTAAFQPDACL
jgi:hypothetical protein